jgi:hypothetical protein
MGRPKGPAKGKFDDLNSEFKETVESMSDEDIKKKVSEVALLEHENRAAKDADQDLEEKMAQAKMAGESYREASKQHKLMISYAYVILQSRGKA